ncbi:hypothetical protein ACFOWX_10260 [Sphingorhabdus arenilitoris]|uniref:Invasion associated locus B family protein n=1 Tax=Sphingorhabdus arenilitoris TaxID=1490041 RepID=A0ABV8RJX3_9SPHN
MNRVQQGGPRQQGAKQWPLLITLTIAAAVMAAPAAARDRLGIYNGWAAFKDAETPRCYAIASPEERISGSTRPGYLSIGFWPKRGVTHQLYVSLSRDRSANSAVTLTAGGRRFRLQGTQTGGWATDRRMDLAIIAAIRSSASLSVESIGRDGRSIVDAYNLRGAPSAIDAAALGCAG